MLGLIYLHNANIFISYNKQLLQNKYISSNNLQVMLSITSYMYNNVVLEQYVYSKTSRRHLTLT